MFVSRFDKRSISVPPGDGENLPKPVNESDKPLCDLCLHFRWRSNISHWRQLSSFGGPDVLEEAYHHYRSFRELQLSAGKCFLCAMIRDEILQGHAWRKFAAENIDVLDSDFVRRRNRFPIEDIQLSHDSLSTAIFLWTIEELKFSLEPSHIQISTTEWLEEDLIRSNRIYDTFGDMRERWKDMFLDMTYPRLDVQTFKSEFCATFYGLGRLTSAR